MAKTFLSDVLPMFGTGDIACMTRLGVKLDDAEWMCNADPGKGFSDHRNARAVFAVLSDGSMPPGAAWPKSRLQTYEQWMQDGFLK
jgi:hypothetical protein